MVPLRSHARPDHRARLGPSGARVLGDGAWRGDRRRPRTRDRRGPQPGSRHGRLPRARDTGQPGRGAARHAVRHRGRHLPGAIRGFAPMPSARLPFRSVLVASRNDPWMRGERAVAMAEAWGSVLVDAGEVEHLNTAAGFGPWPAGERLVADLHAAVAADG
ncbi:MAG TPA: alpha/beta hydrolase [Candidatus Binatia bacterium]|nr:alpha/beta hydrolase [Candidatus Binatia bacterium]